MNEHQRRAEVRRQDMTRFLRDLSAGQAVALDRFGATVAPGGKLLYHNEIDLLFDVVAVNPVLDLNLPAGLLEVMVTVTFPIRMAANQRMPGAIVVSAPPVQDIPRQPDEEPHAEEPTADGEADPPASVQP